MADGSAAFDFTPAVEAQTAPVWDKVKRRVTPAGMARCTRR